MKVLVVGDTHGNLNDIDRVVSFAVDEGISLILQVGDWGYLFRSSNEMRILDRLLDATGVKMWWLDGNHENFYLMSAYGCSPDDVSDTWITSNIRYLPRGFRFELGELSCMAFGGAISVDKESAFRVSGSTWWAEEAITLKQVDAVKAFPVDVLFTHDVHSGVPLLEEYLRDLPKMWPDKPLRESCNNRTLLAMVVAKVTPKVLIHGHYHYRYTDVSGPTKVIGLGHGNGNWKDFFIVLETEGLYV